MPDEVVGRERELEIATEFLDRVEFGPGVVAFNGEAGIGKTTVWRAVGALAEGRGYRLLTARPTEPDRGLSFAGVADLLVDVPAEVFARLPRPQRSALDAALLRGESEAAPDPRAVFTAAVSVVTAVAAEIPILLAVDDLQWLDAPSARALHFLARRLREQRVGVLVASRVPDGGRAGELLAALDRGWSKRVEIGPLTLAAMHELLVQHLQRSFRRPTLVRIQQTSGGNPLFALELAHALGSSEPRPGEPLPVPDDLVALVRTRIERLPSATRRALLRAAALAQPTPALVGRSLAPARKCGLIRDIGDGRITFAHPLYASAVYEAAAPEARRGVHRDLAERVDDLEERARHLALAARGPDDSVAAALDNAAARARSRGAPEIAADLQARALALTPPTDGRSEQRRALATAEDYFRAGALARARELLTATLEQPLDRPLRARALHLLGQVRFREESVPEAIDLLRRAADEAGDDPELRAPVELDLVFALVSVSMDHAAAQPHAEALVTYAERLAEPALLAEALAVAVMIDFLLGRGMDEARLARALSLEDPEHRVDVAFRPSLIAGFLAFYRGDFDRARRFLYPLRARLYEHGKEADVTFLVATMGWIECWAGDLLQARRFVDEALEAATLTESETMMAASVAFGALVDAYAGKLERCREQIENALELAARSGYDLAAMWASAARAVLELSLGNASGAHDALRPWAEFVEKHGIADPITAFYLPDEIEALIALDELDRAEALTDALAARGRDLDRPWALATSGRCRALLSAARGDLEMALVELDRALAEHERLAMPLELGRTLLMKGQIERRTRRKAAAKASFERALALFEQMGASLWAEKTRSELARVGLRPAAPTELTETERRVAELAASGLTNREVAAQLYVSAKTVEAHLRSAYRKLGIRSRAELGARLAGARREPAQT